MVIDMINESRKLINTRNVNVKIGEHNHNFLLDKNNEIYVRSDDLKEFGGDVGDFKHWIIKNSREYPHYSFESYYTEENGVAVKIYKVREVCFYIEDMMKPEFMIIFYNALNQTIQEELKLKNNE
jgi:hypothetical protein